VRQINYGTRARLGLILPSGNQLAEPQLAALMPSGVSMHTTRLALTGSSQHELMRMADSVEEAASLLRDAEPDLILFHCTAVSSFSEALEAQLVRRIESSGGRRATTTAQALIASLTAVEARRIVMLSPYCDEVNAREATFFRSAGFDICAVAGFGFRGVADMMAITPERWKEFAVDHRDPSADAYVISCTATRSLEAIHDLEAILGRPVITSNSAAFWHAMALMGIDDPISGPERHPNSPTFRHLNSPTHGQ